MNMASIILLIVSLLVAPNTVLAEGNSFRHIQLTYGISLDIPSNWTVLSEDMRNKLDTYGKTVAGKAGVELKNGKKEGLLAVNATPSPTGAMIRVSVIMPCDVTQDELATLSASDLKVIGTETKNMFMKMAASGGPKIVEMQPVRVEKINNRRALVLPYIRTSAVGPSNWQVNQYKIPVSDKTIELTLSYRLSDANVWRPILERVKRSVRF